MCGRVGGDRSSLAGRQQPAPHGWLSAAQASPWRDRGQIESQIGACLLHLSYFFTQHFVKLKFKVQQERPDNES